MVNPHTTDEKEREIMEVIDGMNEAQAKFCLKAFLVSDQIPEHKIRAAETIARDFGVGYDK
jgi:hypothetical protein